MAKKTFKGGLDSLIENSLGIKKLKGNKKKEFKGNPVDLVNTEEQEEKTNNEALNTTQQQPSVEEKTENQEQISQPSDVPEKEVAPKVNLEQNENDTENITFLKNMIKDLRHELFLWRNGKINVQTFNQSLHVHNLKYNPDNNEIEEM